MTPDQITVANAPAISGLSFRHFRGESDYPHMLAVIMSSAEADKIERADTVEENEKFNRKRGHTEGIGVGRAWRRRGLARALIARSLQAQKAAGMSESALVADSDSISGVTRLYEICGFQVVRRNTVYRKPF
jgi:ribosomal protein S18 acetylase RimI-like enzyme